jgi:hypothetical protein
MNKKKVKVTVTETVYRCTRVTVLVGPEDDVEEKARAAALNAEWEDVSSDGFEYKYVEPKWGYVYKYLDAEGKPLRACPGCGCGADLTVDGAVLIYLCDETREWTARSRLDADGILDDPTGEVERGRHSHTDCGLCGKMLVDLDGVEELQL